MPSHTGALWLFWFIPVLALVALPWVFASAARLRRLLLVLVLIAWCLPLLIPLQYSFLRFLTVCALLIPTVRSLQIVSGHESPRNYFEALSLFSLPAVIRFDTERKPDSAGARHVLFLTFVHLVLIVGLWSLVAEIQHPALLILTAQVGCYLMLSVMTGIPVAMLKFRGIDHDPPFREPFRATTPAEFWGYRWNTWFAHLLHRYVFLPVGGRRNAARGIFAAFFVSGVIHEAIVGIAAFRVTGLMLLYFLVQAALVVFTSRLKPFRLMAKRQPTFARAITAALLLASGVLIVAGALPLMRL